MTKISLDQKLTATLNSLYIFPRCSYSNTSLFLNPNFSYTAIAARLPTSQLVYSGKWPYLLIKNSMNFSKAFFPKPLF